MSKQLAVGEAMHVPTVAQHLGPKFSPHRGASGNRHSSNMLHRSVSESTTSKRDRLIKRVLALGIVRTRQSGSYHSVHCAHLRDSRSYDHCDGGTRQHKKYGILNRRRR